MPSSSGETAAKIVVEAPCSGFIAFTSVSATFLAEVHAGDTLYPQLVITDLSTENGKGKVTTKATIHNHRGEQVLEGQHTYLLKLASQATA